MAPELGLAVSIAHNPCLRCQSSSKENDLSSGHAAMASGCSAPRLLLTFGLPSPFDCPASVAGWGLVLGGDVSGQAVRLRKSTGRILACCAALAAFRNLAACLFAAMLAAISRERLAFLTALRCLAAALLAAMRASWVGVRVSPRLN